MLVRRIDIAGPIPGRYDLVSLFFVIHRLRRWRPVVRSLAKLLAPRGSLYVSEFLGPSGMIYLSNENGGAGRDPVSRLIRRFFELLPGRFDPELKSSFIAPVRKELRRLLRPAGHRDFVWRQTISVAQMYGKIAGRVYAPFFGTHPSKVLLGRLKAEFRQVWRSRSRLVETIRIYRFTRNSYHGGG